MSDGLRIRIGRAAEGGLIADISRRTFYDSFAAQNTKENMDLFLREQFTREMLIAETEDPGSIFLLAVLDGELAGYVRMRDGGTWPEPGVANAIEIARIYSEQWAIGKGVGKALMQRCLEIAAEKQKEWIWLGVWEHNLRAIGFYTKWGFEKFGEHIFFVGRDPQTDWLMKKRIG
jgi:ribosomal protein S18 acetylase RimI-like enzyme